MSTEEDVQTLLTIYRDLSSLLAEIQTAVIAADTERLSELVPQQEELLRRAAALPLPSQVPDRLAEELSQAAAEAMRRNTTNAVLLSEQLGLIQETIKAILGDKRAVDRLA